MFLRSTCLAAILALLAVPALAADNVRPSLALNRVLPEVRFEGVPLADAIEYLRDVSGANLHVNWRALESAAVGKETPVTLRLRRVPLRKVLKTMLNEAAPGVLAFYVEDNVIHVTTRELADEQMITRVFDVRDLLIDVPDFSGPDFNLGTGTGNAGGGFGGSGGFGSSGGSGGFGSSGGSFGGSGNTGLFGNNSGSNNNDDEKTLTRAERAEQLIDLITSTIRPEIWQVNGGKASIRYFNGNLVITAPRTVLGVMGMD